jgi:transmembrane sensor
MTPLRTPIANVLRDDFDRASAHHVWQGVAVRRIQRRQARERRNLALAFGAGLCAAVVLLFASGLTTVTRPATVLETPTAALAPRAPIDWQEVAEPASRERALEFTDGSRIVLSPSGRLAPLENTGRSVVFLLKDGRAEFDVHPGGPRRWSIEAGFATVEVVGTHFVVTRTRDQVTVEVERGSVLVRGERVTDRAQRLGAGDRLVIHRETPVTAAPVPPSIEPPSAALRVPVSSGPPRALPPAASPVWRELVQQGDYAEAYQNLGADGIAGRAKTADVEQLLALADVARLSGHPRDAVEPLRRAVAEHRSDPRAAMAAFMLGRLHLDSLQDAAAAVEDFRAAIALHLPRALLEDAYLRLIEAATKAGDRQAAREAGQAHRQQFPGSTRRPLSDP